MTPLRVDIADPREAQVWCGEERLAVAFLYDERLHLRIEPRADGRPWVLDATALGLAVDEAARRIGAD